MPRTTEEDVNELLHLQVSMRRSELRYGRDKDVARSREAGFVTHLVKPVSIQSLEHALAVATSNDMAATANGITRLLSPAAAAT